MTEFRIQVPKRCGLGAALQISDEINLHAPNHNIILDFEKMGYAGPSSLVLIPQVVNQARNMHRTASITAVNYKQCTYPAHMGFFRAFDVEFGNQPGQAKGSQNYIPVTIEDIVSLQRKALSCGLKIGELVESSARGLAQVLASNSKGSTVDIFTYCICEMIRNVAEHSESRTVQYCAQYWPSQDRAEIAILDSGIGVRATLSKNPSLGELDLETALSISIKPGVSRKRKDRTITLQDDYWSNEGCGLYLVSELCRSEGNFFIGSHGKALYIDRKQSSFVPFPFLGTMVRMVIRPSRIGSLANLIGTLKAIEGNELKDSG